MHRKITETDMWYALASYSEGGSGHSRTALVLADELYDLAVAWSAVRPAAEPLPAWIDRVDAVLCDCPRAALDDLALDIAADRVADRAFRHRITGADSRGHPGSQAAGPAGARHYG